EGARVRDGADSFVIEDGWIVAQTIHYTVEKK
ncbi:MAG: nuclear transport factor 2 family protein, partial [Mycolicibacterium sp.]|nr:nuclear transport factor 2 family protein [Mycolicibacterium sp.]